MFLASIERLVSSLLSMYGTNKPTHCFGIVRMCRLAFVDLSQGYFGFLLRAVPSTGPDIGVELRPQSRTMVKPNLFS